LRSRCSPFVRCSSSPSQLRHEPGPGGEGERRGEQLLRRERRSARWNRRLQRAGDLIDCTRKPLLDLFVVVNLKACSRIHWLTLLCCNFGRRAPLTFGPPAIGPAAPVNKHNAHSPIHHHQSRVQLLNSALLASPGIAAPVLRLTIVLVLTTFRLFACLHSALCGGGTQTRQIDCVLNGMQTSVPGSVLSCRVALFAVFPSRCLQLAIATRLFVVRCSVSRCAMASRFKPVCHCFDCYLFAGTATVVDVSLCAASGQKPLYSQACNTAVCTQDLWKPR
jgi:hypothetical protein